MNVSKATWYQITLVVLGLIAIANSADSSAFFVGTIVIAALRK